MFFLFNNSMYNMQANIPAYNQISENFQILAFGGVQ